MYMHMYVYVYMALPTEVAQLGKFESPILIIQDEQVIALHVQYNTCQHVHVHVGVDMPLCRSTSM